MFVLMRLESPMAAPARLGDLQVLDGPPEEIPAGYLLFEMDTRENYCHGMPAPTPVSLDQVAMAEVFSSKASLDDDEESPYYEVPYSVVRCNQCLKVLDECSEEGYEQRWHVRDVFEGRISLDDWGRDGEGTGARFTHHRCEGGRWRKAWWRNVDVEFEADSLF